MGHQEGGCGLHQAIPGANCSSNRVRCSGSSCVVTGRGQVVTVSDGRGQVVTVSDGRGQVVTVSDGRGQVVTVSDGRGHVVLLASLCPYASSSAMKRVLSPTGLRTFLSSVSLCSAPVHVSWGSSVVGSLVTGAAGCSHRMMVCGLM